ncbi:ABC transporter substrate-binding protein [Polaromonas eurypsychrophila]|uniref:Branched-chain amino acid-binding protein n=1 Tax=Polaromonas eurypsychrophila TaxID=1614635 RepID=A0A916WDN9_9BURK|nr:ABC transporter substrate-binding protein [Polaromonas eurypsychrophila]GGA90138.1 branched-chain amino acid-binding protein [Polaromonas eurypsychrophila]
MKSALAILLTLFAVVAAPASAQKEKAAVAGPILVGQSAGLTGGQAQYSADVKQGIEAFFNAVNTGGGINGRQIKLISEDDKGKKENVVANTKKLVETDGVTALIGYTSGAGVEATLGYIDGTGVPMLSPATGNMGIRASFHKSLFHTRAGYDDEMKKMVSHLALTGVKRFAIAYLDDVGPANPQAMHDALTANKLKAVVAVPLNRNATDFNAQVITLLEAKPEVVLFISNGTPVVKIIEGMRANGYGGQFATSSFSGLKVIDDLKALSTGLIMSQVLPPTSRTHLKLIKDYQQHLQAFAPGAKPNSTSLEGYIAARVLVEAMQRSGSSLGAGRLIAALENIRQLDLGGYEVKFSPTNHDGSRRVDTGVVGRDGSLRF